jgi:23S rRNA (uracil1939-C5)-methyltransferase
MIEIRGTSKSADRGGRSGNDKSKMNQKGSQERLGVGDVVDVEVERIVPGGLGLCRLPEKTLFVSLAAPGDRAQVRIQRVQGRTAFGEIVELIESSAQRAEPFCPYFGRCGGCDFQHLSYEAQLAAKSGIVADCLRRIAGIAEPLKIEIVPSPDPIEHRSRAEWQLSGNRDAFGYIARGSHQIVDIESCPVLVPELSKAFKRVRDLVLTGKRTTEDRQLQAAAVGEHVSLSPPTAGFKRETLDAEIAGERYQFNADCFFQTNLQILPALVGEAMRFADEATESSKQEGVETGGSGKSTAVDLYSGVGLFTIPLARRFDRVTAVEVHHLASSFAQMNVEAAGLSNVRLTPMPVDRWLATRGRSLKHVGLAIVDPPRSGLGVDVVEGLVRMRPHRIAYVSCDPATLARDVKGLAAHGYVLERVIAFDMFPQTHHVETVSHLTLSE